MTHSHPLDSRHAWKRFCGFLDMSGPSVSQAQSNLLKEQLGLISGAPAGQILLRGAAPATVDEFRSQAPLTTYEDYADILRPGADNMLPSGKWTWSHTYYGPGREKWAPFNERGFDRFLDSIMASLILAAAERPGDVRIRPGDRVLYNVAPRPFLVGFAATGLRDRFGLRGVIDPEEAESMDFAARTEAGFKRALDTGVDIIVSLTSVLLKAGERISARGSHRDGEERDGGHGMPLTGRVVGRVARAKLASVFARREMRPSDLWQPRAVVGWGLDTRHLADEVARFWGRKPFELYASTEGGVMGVQARQGAGMVFIPYSAFYEFLPESESEVLRQDPGHRPQTALLDEVEPGKTYELVISSFYGMPFLRYRTGHLVRFGDGQLPCGREFEFVGRADDRIDLCGFTRIEEGTVWRALKLAGVQAHDWTMRRELAGADVRLSLYLETPAQDDLKSLAHRLQAALAEADPLYRDLDLMLGVRPLKVTTLPAGAFSCYSEARRRAGAPLLSWRPPRMNAGEAVIAELLSTGAAAVRRAA